MVWQTVAAPQSRRTVHSNPEYPLAKFPKGEIAPVDVALMVLVSTSNWS